VPHDPVAPAVSDEVLESQLAYYRARAPEYDDWFARRGRYFRGEQATAAWEREVDDVRLVLGAIGLAGLDVLELAPGTGIWTAELLAAGAAVTAVDAAPEMLGNLHERLAGPGLTTVLADLFAWEPPRRFDAVVSCFFMSHVPDELFDTFMALLADASKRGARIFLLDGLAEPTSTAEDHVLPSQGVQTMTRRLDDGRTFEIVKRFRADEEIRSAAQRHGLSVEVLTTPTYFQMVVGTAG
jgi:demethylmenaquinone methyltransferase/2-methoxy-6-polyprenyl-1,4-benzoquinol methylase